MEFGPAEVGPVEVGLAEVGTAEVRYLLAPPLDSTRAIPSGPPLSILMASSRSMSPISDNPAPQSHRTDAERIPRPAEEINCRLGRRG